MYDYIDLDTIRLHETGVCSVISVDGMTGLPAIRGDVYDRPENDGAIEPANQYLGSRIISVEGSVWGTTVDTAWSTWNLIGAVALGAVRSQKLLKFRHLGGSIDLQYTVRLASSGNVVFTGGADGPFINYQLVMRAADPYAYSQTLQQQSVVAASSGSVGVPWPMPFPVPWSLASSAGAVTCTNAGNAPTWPLLVVQGPLIGPVITNATQGKSLYFDTLSLNVGDTLTIDTNPATRSATVNGVNKFAALRYADSEFFTISAGASESIAFYGLGGGATGATTLTVQWRNAYIT